MKNYRFILIIGIIEILIGGITLLANSVTFILGTNTKSPSVLLFVLIASIISTLIGVGLLKFKKQAYWTLLYFSSVIILSKILIFLNVMHLNGALETAIPADFKRFVSMVYHGLVIYYLARPGIQSIFHK